MWLLQDSLIVPPSQPKHEGEISKANCCPRAADNAQRMSLDWISNNAWNSCFCC